MYFETEFETCTNASQLDEFLQILSQVEAISDEKELLLNYKCLKPCMYMEYKVEITRQSKSVNRLNHIV